MTRWHWQSVLACPVRRDGHDRTGEPGDCFRTALADLLELDPRAVPNFVRYLSWHDEARRFVRAWSGGELDLVYLDAPDPWQPIYEADRPAHVLGTVRSPRGPYHHTVVLDARTGLLVHDPNPLGLWRPGARFTPSFAPPPAPETVGVHALCPFWQGEALDPLPPRLALPAAS